MLPKKRQSHVNSSTFASEGAVTCQRVWGHLLALDVHQSRRFEHHPNHHWNHLSCLKSLCFKRFSRSVIKKIIKTDYHVNHVQFQSFNHRHDEGWKDARDEKELL